MTDSFLLTKSAIPAWVTHLRQQYRVVGPKPVHGQTLFGEITSAAELDLDYARTAFPPKKFLFPPREQLLRYQLDGSHFEAILEGEPTVILGIHTCDLHAITLFDRIFSQGFVDPQYQKRRENTLLVTLECLVPCSPQAFCRDMGSWRATDGFDLHLLDLGDAYAVTVGTERGAQLLAGFEGAVAMDESAQFDAVVALHRKEESFPRRLDLDNGTHALHQLLGQSFESDLWQELGAKCLACGMCTQVCPTCVCFDVTDEADLTLTSGERVRRWDSCQMRQFALVAGGHNFRKARAARQRHRFMRKGKYMYDAYALDGCVGCGRCATVCLVHIAPIDVFNELAWRAEEQAETAPVQEVIA